MLKIKIGKAQKIRCVKCKPDATYFKPRGIPMTELEEKAPTIDELEAIMLADYEGLYHKDASCATLTEKLPSVF